LESEADRIGAGNGVVQRKVGMEFQVIQTGDIKEYKESILKNYEKHGTSLKKEKKGEKEKKVIELRLTGQTLNMLRMRLMSEMIMKLQVLSMLVKTLQMLIKILKQHLIYPKMPLIWGYIISAEVNRIYTLGNLSICPLTRKQRLGLN
jgi:hypothetical protein